MTATLTRPRIYFGGASPNCGADVRLNIIQQSTLAHKNPTPFRRGSMSTRLQDLSDKGYQILDSMGIAYNGMPFPISGLITSFIKRANDLTERKDIDKDKLTLAMVTRRGKSLDAIKEAKRREEE